MKTSIIISVFNKTHYLRNCLLSIMSQSAAPDEIIIADDGSSEDIIGGIKDLVAQCPWPVTHVRQPDNGFRLAKSRNNGAKQARGEYLVFVDQDMIFTKHYLEQILAHQATKRFYAAYPAWLDEEQTRLINPDLIRSGRFDAVSTPEQRNFIYKQYRKERLYTLLHSLKLRQIGPALRGCVFSFYKSDFVNVNGFDETYQSWGYEDDDLGYRLYASGVSGLNRIYKEYSLHCYHPKAQRADNGRSINRPYFRKRKKEINKNNYRCEYGYDTPLGDDSVTVTALN